MKEIYNFIAIKSSNIRILVIGAGRAAYIKTKSFLNKNAKIYIVAPNINTKFDEFKNYSNIEFINTQYKEEYLLDKHLVIIATDNESLNSSIKNRCDKLGKIYIYCSNKDKSICFNSYKVETETMMVGINSKKTCPKATVFLGNKIKKELLKYDKYIKFAADIRDSLKGNPLKNNIMDFICGEDFYYFFSKNHGKTILELFYGGINFEGNNRNEKK